MKFDQEESRWLPALSGKIRGPLVTRIGTVLRAYYRGRPFGKPLAELSDAELLAIPGLGWRMVDAIREVLPAPA